MPVTFLSVPGRQQGFPLRIRFALILRRIGVVIAARLGPFGIGLAGSGLDVLAGEPPHVVTPWSRTLLSSRRRTSREPLMASAPRLAGNVRRLGSGGEPHWIRN